MSRFRPLPPIKSIEEYEAEIDARHPDLARYQKKPAPPTPIVRPIDCIALGIDDLGRALKIDDKPRAEHMHVIGVDRWQMPCNSSTMRIPIA
jgi:hypothetical protein